MNKLIDKYERRSDYGSEEKSPRRTMTAIDKGRYPDYFHLSDSTFRESFNRAMLDLERRGWVELKWVPYEEGQTLSRVVLRTDRLEDIYEALGRKPKDAFYRELSATLADFAPSAPAALRGFIEDLDSRLRRMAPLAGPLSSMDRKDLRDLLLGLGELFKPRPETLERVFSVSLYGDSKRFGEIERAVLWVLERYCLEPGQAGMHPEDVLSEFGIVKHPVHIHLHGPLVFETARGRVDCALFYPDLGLSPAMVRDLRVVGLDARAVVTVENLSAFYRYIDGCPEDTLVLYLGGYHNHARRSLLLKVAGYLSESGRPLAFYHWGDIDLGGFLIWNHLRSRTGLPIQPLMMDEKTLGANISRAQKLAGAYSRRLEPLLEDEVFAPFHGVIRMMLSQGVRLEQEGVAALSFA